MAQRNGRPSLTRESGEISIRTILELGLVFLVGYAAFEIGPVVMLRMKFLDQMQFAAYSPPEKDLGSIKRELLETAEGFQITLLAENLKVERDRELRKTLISAEYDLFIHFFPAFTYTWRVKDQVEGYF
jgi:hypothetical protein